MKVKELLKTVNVAWSPPTQYPILLAAGTAAQQLDASFNTSASLDLYLLNLQQPGYDMELKASVPSDQRFYKIIWGSYGSNPSGIIAGGCDHGTIKIYSAAKILSRESDCLLSSPDKHTGPVRALDLNPFQSNLLASGATESEIFIWDIVNTTTPMTPGTRSQPAEDVQYIQWNKQVQHILASTFSQRCVIWDLRKNEPIIKLTDANAKIRWKAVQWHPEIPTQLCLASEDDQAPIIQLWDLRFATSPLKSFQHHQRGVLSIAWNGQDPDLLLSCAKDNSILCWNPNADAPEDQLLGELAQTNQWNFDVVWCPRSPGLIVGSSFDGHATVYSLLGGQQQASSETSNKIVDSFPGMDPFSQPPPVVHAQPAIALKKAPKWLRKSAGALFGFGGKLITFENEPAETKLIGVRRKVIVSQVITNPELIQRSSHLETALASEQFEDFCQDKALTANDEHSKKVWNFIGAYFTQEPKQSFFNLLGYDEQNINNKFQQYVPQDDVNEITESIANLDNVHNGNTFDGGAAFDAIAQQEQKKAAVPTEALDLLINTSDDKEGLITQAILIGNIEAAVALCFESKRYADAVILSVAGGPELLAKTQYRYFAEHTGALNCLINCLVSENWSDIVKNCNLNNWKDILVGIYSHTLCAKECSALCDALGDRLASSDDPTLKKNAQLCFIRSGNLNKMIGVSKTDIQETVELVVIMKRALERESWRKNVTIDGNIATVLSQYAEMLASEGDFESALNYVGDGEDPKIAMLRDRLYKATSYLDTQQMPEQPPMQMNTKQPATNYYEQTPNVSSQALSMPKWNTNPTQNAFSMKSFSSGGTPVQTMQPIPTNKMPTQHIQSPQPVMQPKVPPMTPLIQTSGSQSGSRPSSVGAQSGPKYVIDRSVNSGFSYNNYPQPGYNSPSQSSGFPGQNPYQPSGGNYQNYMPAPVLPEQDHYKPIQPNIMTPTLPAHPPQGNIQGSLRTQPSQQGQIHNSEPIYQPPSHVSGWNDPPIAKSRVRPTTDYQPPNPIFQPLPGAVSQQEYPPEVNYHQDPRMAYNQQQYGHNAFNAENQYNKPYETMTPMHIPAQPVQPVEIAKVAEPEKPKPPIPEQHLFLKTALDALRIQCYEAARNPQMKRKIEDVTKKLDVLYDCLRENTLSKNTLQGLHQISQMIQAGDYTNGLAVHTQLVSGPDFSQIASFMPGIKVLLQSALQLGVYIS